MIFFRILLISLILKLSLFACAGGYDYWEKEFNFLLKRDLPFSNITEDLKSAYIYNELNWEYQRVNKEKNLLEWKAFLKDAFTTKELEEIIYKRKNINKIKNKEVLEYLDFVKRQEKHVTPTYYYYSKPKKEVAINYDEYINEALTKLEKTTSSWLKLRYFYLALRLAHYKKRNPLEVYTKYKYLLDSKQKTIVKDWIISLYGGALIKNKQISKGVYQFTKLFNKSKINWYQSFYNFHHINTNELWQELLTYAKDSEELAKFYAIRALNYNSNMIEELKNIYKIDKNSKWFDFVLYRKLLDTQHYFDKDDFQGDFYDKKFPYKDYINYLKTIKKDDMYLVELALGYFNLYINDLKNASSYEKNLQKINPNSYEVKSFSYILYLNKLEDINFDIENEIYEKMTSLLKEKKSDSIHDYTFVITKKLYEKKGDKINSFLSQNINHIFESSFNLFTLDEFEKYMKTNQQSKLRNYFRNRYLELNILEKDANKIELSTSLKKAKVKLLINNLKFKEALKIKSKYLETKIEFNPFNSFIRGNNREGKKHTYTVKKFLQTMIKIKKKLNSQANSVMDNYLYANALYNLSYFGNSNILTTVYRSTYSFNDKRLQEEKINLANKHYLKALKNAKKKEFKSKITYMLAKSELASYDIKYADKSKYYYNRDFDQYSLDRYWGFNNEKAYKEYVKNQYGKYFDKLENDFNDTKYYQEVLNECGNLRFYQKLK